MNEAEKKELDGYKDCLKNCHNKFVNICALAEKNKEADICRMAIGGIKLIDVAFADKGLDYCPMCLRKRK